MKHPKTNKENDHCKPHTLELAIKEFVKQGGIIDAAPSEVSFPSNPEKSPTLQKTSETVEDYTSKVELLKDLITKGAGIYALQYSLKMNKDEIKRMAREQGLKIAHRRPLCPARKHRPHQPESADTQDDDVIAGHAMHYAALGYTALEIAQTLELSVRQVWELARNYRFELQQRRQERMD